MEVFIMSNKYSDRVVVRLEDTCQQKLHIVKPVPEAMDQDSIVVIDLALRGSDQTNRLPFVTPKKIPDDSRYICTVEWAWSPAHNRVDGYELSLSEDESHWIFWFVCPCLNQECEEVLPWDNEDPLSQASLCCSAEGVDEHRAAAILLKAFWEEEVKFQDLDKYHLLNDTGILSVHWVESIADTVW